MNTLLPKDYTVMLYMVYVDGVLEEIFTNKTQAEAFVREFREQWTKAINWRIVERQTQPHER